MKNSAISFAIATVLLLCLQIVHASSQPDNTVQETADNESPTPQRFVQTAQLSMENVDRDLALPEQYFLQACLRKAFQTKQHDLLTVEVLGSTMIEDTAVASSPHQHGRSLDDWSWLYNYNIFFEYGCGYDCYGGGRRLRRRQVADIHRIEQRICKLLRHGPYEVFHSASGCHLELDDTLSEHS